MTATLDEVQARLPQLLAILAPGEELEITRGCDVVSRLVAVARERPRPVPGRGRGKLVIVSEDEDHLDAFKDYMP